MHGGGKRGIILPADFCISLSSKSPTQTKNCNDFVTIFGGIFSSTATAGILGGDRAGNEITPLLATANQCATGAQWGDQDGYYRS